MTSEVHGGHRESQNVRSDKYFLIGLNGSGHGSMKFQSVSCSYQRSVTRKDGKLNELLHGNGRERSTLAVTSSGLRTKMAKGQSLATSSALKADWMLMSSFSQSKSTTNHNWKM